MEMSGQTGHHAASIPKGIRLALVFLLCLSFTLAARSADTGRVPTTAGADGTD